MLGPLALHKFKYCFILQLTPNHMFILRVNIIVHYQINIKINLNTTETGTSTVYLQQKNIEYSEQEKD